MPKRPLIPSNTLTYTQQSPPFPITNLIFTADPSNNNHSDHTLDPKQFLFPENNSSSKSELPYLLQAVAEAQILRRPSAIVYCESNFGKVDGKTANGLSRHSETYKIESIIDSDKAGRDAGMELDGKLNGIPICHDLADSLTRSDCIPDFYIFGMAPSSGMLSTHERGLIFEAMALGMNIVNGLHEFLNDDAEMLAASQLNKVQILDIRKPRAKKDLRLFSGAIKAVTCPRIAVLGTDGAIGKRTTATILTRALNDQGIKAILISTGQTGLIQGSRYGVALDAIPSQFCSGEMEASIVEAFTNEQPDVIIIEGQGALSHPAYLSSSFILRGSQANAVVLQHAPG
ncbi:MAG: DUF1611 domain-containing protein, partial [Gammaproteobacteria bacterium]|nr:DUF1611 domain-containing protein [Gammaproteobacteria bacterium]